MKCFAVRYVRMWSRYWWNEILITITMIMIESLYLKPYVWSTCNHSSIPRFLNQLIFKYSLTCSWKICALIHWPDSLCLPLFRGHLSLELIYAPWKISSSKSAIEFALSADKLNKMTILHSMITPFHRIVIFVFFRHFAVVPRRSHLINATVFILQHWSYFTGWIVHRSSKHSSRGHGLAVWPGTRRWVHIIDSSMSTRPSLSGSETEALQCDSRLSVQDKLNRSRSPNDETNLFPDWRTPPEFEFVCRINEYSKYNGDHLNMWAIITTTKLKW